MQIQTQNRVPCIERYKKLKQFKIKKGHCEVPQQYNDNPSLGIWVVTQRQKYKLIKEGKRLSLIEDKLEALEDIGFTWKIKKTGVFHTYNYIKS